VDQLVRDGIEAAIRDERERFHGTEGVVRLVHWFEKMENTFKIRCEVANERPWTKVKQMMTDEFYLTEEVQRLEDELRHLKLRDMNIAAYTERPATLNEAVRMAHTLMEQKIQAKNERIAEAIKKKWENNNQGNNNNNNNNNNSHNRGNYRNNNHYNQNNNRRQNNARALTTAQNEGENQTRIAPNCNRCERCHFDQCPPKCVKIVEEWDKRPRTAEARMWLQVLLFS
nr:hypothetical protein [Tanacetum cinerariifolium]